MQNYNQSYLAFVDILGWKNIVNQIGGDFDRFDDIICAFNALQSHESEDEYVRSLSSDVPVNLPPPQHLVASDTIILSTSDNAHALLALILRCGKLCADLLSRGFLTRGAIVRGLLYHRGQVIFGEALSNAYKLEQRSARYPRILISEEVYTRIMESTVGFLRKP